MFKVGDRVECTTVHDNNKEIVNQIGTVKYADAYLCYVDFDIFFQRGHDCGGRCRIHHGWSIPQSKLILVEEEVSIDFNKKEYDEIMF
jgi:hypothetical protein